MLLQSRREFRPVGNSLLVAACALSLCTSLASGQSGAKPESRPPRRSLADLAGKQNSPRSWQQSPVPAIDHGKAQAHGIRKITGRHLTLYTDLPSLADVDELPQMFDAAVPQWCDYFGIPAETAASWKNIGYLIQEKKKFSSAGLLPADLPPFLHGYQRGAELWLYEQPSAYYRRHLLLHEGTHAFMQTGLNGAGPPWYMEGMAELLATHRWHEGQLTLRHFPKSRDEVPDWGRIKIVKDGYRAGQAKSLEEIMRFDSRAHLQVEPYGWCWAACAFFDAHPVYGEPFRNLRSYARDASLSFSERFQGWLTEDWRHIQREWQWFVANLDYGFDIPREAIQRKPAAELAGPEQLVIIAADRGWQSSGVRLEAGKKYRLRAEGRYELASEPKPWWCEPNGITIRYCRGRPLGMLLGAIVDEQSGADSAQGFLSAAGIGMGIEPRLKRSGTLYLRVNDYPAELHDNAGDVKVWISELPQ